MAGSLVPAGLAERPDQSPRSERTGPSHVVQVLAITPITVSDTDSSRPRRERRDHLAQTEFLAHLDGRADLIVLRLPLLRGQHGELAFVDESTDHVHLRVDPLRRIASRHGLGHDRLQHGIAEDLEDRLVSGAG